MAQYIGPIRRIPLLVSKWGAVFINSYQPPPFQCLSYGLGNFLIKKGEQLMCSRMYPLLKVHKVMMYK